MSMGTDLGFMYTGQFIYFSTAVIDYHKTSEGRKYIFGLQVQRVESIKGRRAC